MHTLDIAGRPYAPAFVAAGVIGVVTALAVIAGAGGRRSADPPTA